jgi:hypothetical protein
LAPEPTYTLTTQDVVESLPHEAALKEHDAVKEVLGSLRQPLPTKERMTGAFHELGARMITLDPDGAPRVIEAVRQFLSEYDRDGGTFNTIDEYLTFRFLNVAMGYAKLYHCIHWLIIFRMMTSFMEWNLNINLDDAETELCSTYYRLGGDNMALANDYFSWDMETRDVTDRVRNAVPVLMKQFSLGEREAKVLLKGMIVENEQEMRRVALELERGGISVDVKKYIDGMAVMLGGNSFWSATCPRYRLQ